MKLKDYQEKVLKTLKDYLEVLSEYRANYQRFKADIDESGAGTEFSAPSHQNLTNNASKLKFCYNFCR